AGTDRDSDERSLFAVRLTVVRGIAFGCGCVRGASAEDQLYGRHKYVVCNPACRPFIPGMILTAMRIDPGDRIVFAVDVTVCYRERVARYPATRPGTTMPRSVELQAGLFVPLFRDIPITLQGLRFASNRLIRSAAEWVVLLVGAHLPVLIELERGRADVV